MATELIINATLPETRIALLENNEISELHIERDSERGIVGNIYKGKVIRVLPGMQAAFVDIGLEKAAFLYVDDIFFPDMKTPLVGNPLPESLPKPAPISVQTASGIVAAAGVPGTGPAPIVITPLPPGSKPPVARGRGGRGRFGRGEPKVSEKSALPGTPEAHAQQQAEYARQMLEAERDQNPEAGARAAAAFAAGEAAAAAAAEGSESPAPVSASADPAQTSVPSSQPEARSPDAALPLDPFDDEEDDVESEVAYRPEPLIDADAWAEDLTAESAANEPEAREGEAGTAAPVTAGATASSDAGSEATAPGAAVAEGAVAEAPAPVQVTPSVTPVVVKPVPLEARVAPVSPVGVDDEDEDVAEMPRRRRRREPVNIADIIKEGQEIVVQVAKDPIGTKGARLTCHVSLPGRYLVFMPTVDHIGVSRRIESEGERRRLKETMGKIRPSKTGVIVRTASGKQTDRKLKADLDYLVTTWNDIQKKFLKQRTPSVVYQDLTIVLRAIRDMFTDEVDKVIVDSKREHKAIMKFVTRFIPAVKDKVELYTGEQPIFDTYGIETEISRALERKVYLKSGGTLVIDQAEALVAIDVNTGRYVGKKTLEETILKTNLEAVKEIAYQLRLRNCGGIIILDLIDMEKEANKEKVYKALEEALKKDRARPSILKISQLGLVEMTRKRTRDTMVRSLCEPCSYCEGRGFVKNKLTIAYDIMRDIEREGTVRETQAISIQCHPTVADVLLEDKRDVLEDMEHQFDKKMTIRGNGAYHVEQYELVAHRENKNMVWSSEERRQQLRQKGQERSQQMASELRKVTEADRQEKRREQEDKRREQEEKRREQEKLRAEKRAAAEEKRKQIAADKAALLVAQGLDPNAPIPEGVVVPGLETLVAAEEELEDDFEDEEEDRASVGTDGLPVARVVSPRQDREGREGPGELNADGTRKRRRRGRRGRGGRNREGGTGREGQAEGQPQGGRPPQGRQAQGGRQQQGRQQQARQPRPPAGPPNVRPVTEGGAHVPGGQEVRTDADAFAPSARSEHLGPQELAGSAIGGGDFDNSRDVPENAGGADGDEMGADGTQPADDTRPDGVRKRRRGRRGGRRRRRFGPGEGPEPRVGGAPAFREGGAVSVVPLSTSSSSSRGDSSGGGGSDGGGSPS